jgi:DNA helicase-2/ATP-dependent DNA helicase PcrA
LTSCGKRSRVCTAARLDWRNPCQLKRPIRELRWAGYIVERILENREEGTGLKAQAVLFRASHHSASLEVELTRRNIPFVKFGGLRFLEAAHIKDVLAVLRWVQNIRDRVCGFRVAQLLPGIGPNSAARLLDQMAESTNPLDALGRIQTPCRRG